MTKRSKAEESWPAAKVTLWPVEKIIPYEHNPRTHPPAQIDLIAASMKEDGVTAPIMVDEGGIILYGHGRLMAALQNGYKKYPVIVAANLTDVRKRAIRIKDNALALLSGWDNELMKFEIESLTRAGYEMKLLGFGDAQLVNFTTSLKPPGEFGEFGEDIEILHQCPRCGFKGSGDWSPKKKKPDAKKKKK